ncbi:MAG: nucleotidyltransferase domain-containing protein, partial [Ardenticatenaceae bacterium]
MTLHLDRSRRTTSPSTALLHLIAPGGGDIALPDSDWELLLRLAEQHGLQALLHARLEGVEELLPAAVAGRLRHARKASAAEIAFFEYGTQEVIDLFHQHGVPLVAFKGVPLARALFGDPSLRPTSDIDVMVRRAHLERARQLLEAAGWHIQSEWVIHHNFAKPFGGAIIPLELHWTSQRDGEYHIPEDSLWEEASLAGQAWRFSDEMTLLILVLHAARHAFAPYRLLVDIAYALHHWHDTLDWERLVELAEQSDALPLLALVLALVQRDLAAPPPRHHALQALRQSWRVRLAAHYLSLRHLLARRRFPIFDRYWVPLLTGNWGPLRLFLRDLIPPPDVLAYIYQVPRNSPRLLLY